MKKRILSFCLALALCLSLIPAAVSAASPLYTYQEVKTGVKATDISMMGNGYGSFKVKDNMGDMVSKGVISPDGKVVLSRTPRPGEGMMAGNATNDTFYAGTGSTIVDLQRLERAINTSGEVYDAQNGEGNLFYDLAVYGTDGTRKAYVSDIIARYDGGTLSGYWLTTQVYYGNDGFLTVYGSDWMGQDYAYIIDAASLQVVLKQSLDSGSPAEGGGHITSVYDGLIAYDQGWMDISGRKVLSADTAKYGEWWNFSSGLAMVSKSDGQKIGYIDKTGREVIPCIYGEGSLFKDGYAYVWDEDSRAGYIDTAGKVVIPLQYEYAYGYGEGLFTVGHAGQFDNYYGMVDINNTEVVPIQYTDISIAKNGIAYAIKDGEIVILKFAENKIDPGDVANLFPDVPSGIWYAKYLQKAYDNNIVGGMKDGTFQPQGTLTHAQIMVMVANLHSLMKNDGFKGSSVPGDHWAASYRDYCKKEGVIDARFDEGLDANVTRAEMAYYFARALDIGYYKNKKAASFSDMPENGYDEYIMRLAKADIVGGFEDGTFRPGEEVTRAQAAVFISNIIDAIEAAQ